MRTRSIKEPGSPSSPLATTYFESEVDFGAPAPLRACRKGSAAAATLAGLLHGRENVFGPHAADFGESFIGAVGAGGREFGKVASADTAGHYSLLCNTADGRASWLGNGKVEERLNRGVAIQCHDTVVGPQRSRRTIAETDTIHTPTWGPLAGRGKQVFGTGQHAGCPDTDAGGFRALVQIGVVGERAANCGFGNANLLRQLLDLRGVWKPVISHKR